MEHVVEGIARSYYPAQILGVDAADSSKSRILKVGLTELYFSVGMEYGPLIQWALRRAQKSCVLIHPNFGLHLHLQLCN